MALCKSVYYYYTNDYVTTPGTGKSAPDRMFLHLLDVSRRLVAVQYDDIAPELYDF